jgi:putative DNA methylase
VSKGLTTFSDLVTEAREQVMADCLGARASRPRRAWHSRGYLPHYEAGERPQSISFRLFDSLPRAVVEGWRAEIEHLPEGERDSERRKRIDAYLDAGHGACWLRQEPIAKLVANALAYFDGERYRLHAWCLMPNHVHVLVTPLHGNSLSSILHTWKSFTAKAANKALVRQGQFWEDEYFDRAIRYDEHFATAWAYIEGNPVKAGLCGVPEDWPWSSAGDEERAGRPHSQELVPLDEGGSGARAYAEAVAVYLTFVVEKLSESLSSICT